MGQLIVRFVPWASHEGNIVTRADRVYRLEKL
jgi:hypothetical protein